MKKQNFSTWVSTLVVAVFLLLTIGFQGDKSKKYLKTIQEKTKPQTSVSSNSSKMKSDEATEGLQIDPASVEAAAGCALPASWHECSWKGATQTTYNVRPNGMWEFKVLYCCGLGQCNKTGGPVPTSQGYLKHEELSFSSSLNCLVLTNRQTF
ncbi:hypothetical protein [Pedobacter nutrimenti]|uniref:Uncharacterized protein n=1 Tax=Pedobacter nutrimenti TaxID=1241337 RepID=A0A318UDP0_9SPHI|nr:hypothetical protein [Pedobacter nutrimenti]PYF74193.1 hypothetical protein B0O44_104364 [Pedobacter nutrimenti]